MRTMTMLLAEALPSLHLEGDHLVTLNMVEDLGLDHGLDITTYCEAVTIGQKNFSEFDLITGITRDPGNIQSLVLLNLKLHSGYFHNC